MPEALLRSASAAPVLPHISATPAPCRRLAPNANMRDVILAVRADEACHSHVNHSFSNIRQDEPSPFAHGSKHAA